MIVNYRAYDALTACLESLEPSLGSIAVVVVDHESDAAAAGKLARRFPWAHLLAVPDNPGFAAGVNRGVAQTVGRYVLLLNPDCVVHGDVIRPLAAWLESEPEARRLWGSRPRARRHPASIGAAFPHSDNGLRGTHQLADACLAAESVEQLGVAAHCACRTGAGRLGERRLHDDSTVRVRSGWRHGRAVFYRTGKMPTSAFGCGKPAGVRITIRSRPLPISQEKAASERSACRWSLSTRVHTGTIGSMVAEQRRGSRRLHSWR